ncbi:MAG: hypothetical protein ABIR48_05765 [Gammaproteobacteria bacterium]
MPPKNRQTALLTLLAVLLVLTVISMVGLYLMTQTGVMDELFARIFGSGSR